MRIRRRAIHWKVVRLAAGIALAILGVAGLFLPVLQGILLLVASVLVLSIDVPVFRRLRRNLARRFPAVFQRVEDWLKRRRRAKRRTRTPRADDRQP